MIMNLLIIINKDFILNVSQQDVKNFIKLYMANINQNILIV